MSSGHPDAECTWGRTTQKLTAFGYGLVMRNTAVGPPAAEFVNDTKVIGSRVVADGLLNENPIAIVAININAVTPTATNRFVLPVIYGLSCVSSYHALIGALKATFDPVPVNIINRCARSPSEFANTSCFETAVVFQSRIQGVFFTADRFLSMRP